MIAAFSAFDINTTRCGAADNVTRPKRRHSRHNGRLRGGGGGPNGGPSTDDDDDDDDDDDYSDGSDGSDGSEGSEGDSVCDRQWGGGLCRSLAVLRWRTRQTRR
jgi:hypothetical protein